VLLRTPNLGPPEDYEEIGYPGGMSNFDFEVAEGIEDRLRAERVYTHYAGRDFNGRVWFDAEGAFSCQVWCYGTARATVRAETLHDLMHEVSREWGYC
jgi:hypothetical protein